MDLERAKDGLNTWLKPWLGGIWVAAWLCLCPPGASPATRGAPHEPMPPLWPALHDGTGLRRLPTPEERAVPEVGDFPAPSSDVEALGVIDEQSGDALADEDDEEDLDRDEPNFDDELPLLDEDEVY